MTFTGFSGASLPALRDDFNRADSGLLGGSWREADDVSGNGLEVFSNQVRCNTAGLNSAYWDGIEDNHIGFAYTMAVFDATAYNLAGCVVTADAGNGINPIEFYFVAANSIEIWYSNGTFEGTISLSASFASGDQIGFDCEDQGADNVYKVFRRAAAAGSWAQVGTYTDTASAVGGPWDPGFAITGIIAARYDDFYAEAITAAPPVVTAYPPRRSVRRS